MTPIRAVIASLTVAIAWVAPLHSQAQSAPMPYSLQADAQIPSTTTKQQQDEVINLFTEHLGLWLSKDPSEYPYEQLITEDAVFEYPYAYPESARLIEGRKAVAESLRKLPLLASDWKFSDVKLIETPHPDIFFVEYKATAYVPATGHSYEQRYLARITVRQGKIANYYELWDRDVQAAAFYNTAHN